MALEYSVYQHWDPLDVCVVGKSYPPEFYSWIKDTSVRKKFEQLAIETEEDFQSLICLLKTFNVNILRPDIPMEYSKVGNKLVQPPVAPRDFFIMIQNKLWVPTAPNNSHAWTTFYRKEKTPGWQWFDRPSDCYERYPEYKIELQQKFVDFKKIDQQVLNSKLECYNTIFNQLPAGNQLVKTNLDFISGCFVSRIGKDLYFATQTYYDNQDDLLATVNNLFPDTSNHIVNAGGHGDATYCPVAPGLIISLKDVPTYADTFPGWEVVYLPPSDFAHMREFQSSMKLNQGRWFIPGFENDLKLQQTVDYYFDEWVGQVSETVFDVNILVINPTNIVVSSYNKQVEQACNRYNITMHVVPFRHRYFWDAGTHCITNDLNRIGKIDKFVKF